jgi:hypothetical protein
VTDTERAARELGRRLAEATVTAAQETDEFMRKVHDRDPAEWHRHHRRDKTCDYCDATPADGPADRDGCDDKRVE